MTRTASLRAAALTALALATPAAAGAVEPPDPGRLAVLTARCDSASLTRIETRRSTRLVQRVRLEADAVVLPGPARSAIVQVGPPPADLDTRIPWTEVESLSLGRSHLREGAVAGLVVGAALGGTLVARHGPDAFESGDHLNVGLAIVGTVTFGVLGAVVGAAHPVWTPLYP